jgi:hypothetical protein
MNVLKSAAEMRTLPLIGYSVFNDLIQCLRGQNLLIKINKIPNPLRDAMIDWASVLVFLASDRRASLGRLTRWRRHPFAVFRTRWSHGRRPD